MTGVRAVTLPSRSESHTWGVLKMSSIFVKSTVSNCPGQDLLPYLVSSSQRKICPFPYLKVTHLSALWIPLFPFPQHSFPHSFTSFRSHPTSVLLSSPFSLSLFQAFFSLPKHTEASNSSLWRRSCASLEEPTFRDGGREGWSRGRRVSEHSSCCLLLGVEWYFTDSLEL